MTTNQSCGLIEANFPTKDYEGALMGIHGQSQEQPKGFPPSQDMLTENKTAETCVVVIASFFTPFQKETTGDCSICQGLPVICELLAQLSRIGRSRRCPKDIKRSHILWKSLAGQRQETFTPFHLPIYKEAGRNQPWFILWKQSDGPCTNVQLQINCSLCCLFFS